MNEDLLPLFPLRVVLFPGASLPLHIFEDRYKLLIRECIDSGKEFGINLVNENELQSVGCTAVVSSVVKRYPDGRLDIIVTGRRRYALMRFDAHRAPYLLGHVRFLPPDAEPPDRSLAHATLALYNSLVERVQREGVSKLDPAQCEAGIAYVMAQKAGMDLVLRQQVLETPTENGRLQIVNTYLAGLLPTLERIEDIERIIQNDGYL